MVGEIEGGGSEGTQAAMWVAPWIRKLDIAQAASVRFESYPNLPLKPSEYVRRQLKVTPAPPEPIGWLIEQAAPICSCSRPTFPHPEGDRDPLKKFASSLDQYEIPEEARDRLPQQLRRDDRRAGAGLAPKGE